MKKNLSEYACRDEEAIYLKPEEINPIYTPFYHDTNKIVACNTYSRYMDKTQVFPSLWTSNDHLTKRKIHVELTGRIARTIGRNLGLNEDLIEAGASVHDFGHVPFGHEGERALNKISLKYGAGFFSHNVQSVRNLMFLENNGKGLNVSMQVLDTALCHNGEVTERRYIPRPKTKEEFLEEYYACYQDKSVLGRLHAMTLEGQTVRLSDLVSYIGRDIDDAKRVGILTWEDIPNDIKKILGNSTPEIVDNIIYDVLENSYNKPYLEFSAIVYETLDRLLKFNTANIYMAKLSPEQAKYIEFMFDTMFQIYVQDLERMNPNSSVVAYVNGMNQIYRDNNDNTRIAIDYLAGMTDSYFQTEFNKAMTRIRK